MSPRQTTFGDVAQVRAAAVTGPAVEWFTPRFWGGKATARTRWIAQARRMRKTTERYFAVVCVWTALEAARDHGARWLPEIERHVPLAVRRCIGERPYHDINGVWESLQPSRENGWLLRTPDGIAEYRGHAGYMLACTLRGVPWLRRKSVESAEIMVARLLVSTAGDRLVTGIAREVQASIASRLDALRDPCTRLRVAWRADPSGTDPMRFLRLAESDAMSVLMDTATERGGIDKCADAVRLLLGAA